MEPNILGDLVLATDVYQNVPQEFRARTDEYIERYRRLQTWLKASYLTIKDTLEVHTKEKLPETSSTYSLSGTLQKGKIMQGFIEGEKVISTWMTDNNPQRYQNILRRVKEGKGKFDLFLINLNKELEKNDILYYYRKEKEELINFGKKLIEDMKAEQESLQQSKK